MPTVKNNDKYTPIKGIFLAYFVLAMHVLVIAGLGILVIFFRGIVNYMIWIFLLGSAAILTSAYLFYRRMKKERKTLNDMLNSPLFRGQNVEVSLLGGLAAFRIGRSADAPPMIVDRNDPVKQLEDPSAARIRELSELARLLENDLITIDEFNKVKDQLLKS